MNFGIKYDLLSDFISKQLETEISLTEIIKKPLVYQRDKNNKLYYIVSTKAEVVDNIDISIELASIETGNIHQITIYNDVNVDSLRIYWTVLDRYRKLYMGSIYFLNEDDDFYLSRTYMVNRDKAELVYNEYPIGSNIVQQTLYFNKEGIREFKSYGILKDLKRPEDIYFSSLAYYFDVYECDKTVIIEKGEGLFLRKKLDAFISIKAIKNGKPLFNRREFKFNLNNLVRQDVKEFLAEPLKELDDLL